MVNENRETIILYSKENVIESLKRNIIEKIQMDFRCFRELAHSAYIDFNGRVQFIDPSDIVKEIELDKAMAEALQPLFNNLASSAGNRKNASDINTAKKFDKVELNNIPHDQIITVLEDRLNKTVPKSEYGKNEDIHFDQDLMQSTFKAIFADRLKDYSEIENYDQKIDNIAKLTSDLINNIMKASFSSVQEALKTENGFNPFTLLHSVIPSKSYETAMLTAVLGGLQYFPDDAKLLKRKGVPVDMNDINHVNYASFANVFVTNDSRLARRTLAAITKSGIELKIVGLLEFKKMILEKDAGS
jgi:hypothetical protein